MKLTNILITFFLLIFLVGSVNYFINLRWTYADTPDSCSLKCYNSYSAKLSIKVFYPTNKLDKWMEK